MGFDDIAAQRRDDPGHEARIYRLENSLKLMERQYRDDEAARRLVAEVRQKDDEDRAAWRGQISGDVSALKTEVGGLKDANAQTNDKLDAVIGVLDLAKDAIVMISRPATALRKAAGAVFDFCRRWAIRTRPIVSWAAAAAALAVSVWQFFKGRSGG